MLAPATTPHWQNDLVQVYHGNARDILATLPDQSVQCVVTSPPYFGLRKYAIEANHAGHELGSEPSVGEYIANLVAVFSEVHRVLRDDGACWVNLGDSYAGSRCGPQGGSGDLGGRTTTAAGIVFAAPQVDVPNKSLIGVPWRFAFAMLDAGWILREEVIWHKPSAMPASVKDRPTTAHESIFLFTKRPKYFYDHVAAREPCSPKTATVKTTPRKGAGTESTGEKLNKWMEENGGRYNPLTRNWRSVWTIAARPFKGAHFATFPPELPRRCIVAATSEHGCCPACGAPYRRLAEKQTITRPRPNSHTARHAAGNGVNATPNDVAGVDWVTTGWAPGCQCPPAPPVPCTVLDPFGGSGTTGMVAAQLGRRAILIELSQQYIEQHAATRITTGK